MTGRYLLLFYLAVSCLLFSCGKDNSTVQASIVGKWNLQQQHAILYIDGVKKVDTNYHASTTAVAIAQFNADDTFSSSSNYLPPNYLSNLGAAASSGKTEGTYQLSGNVLSITPGLSGWFSYVTGSSSVPTGVSYSVQLSQLTKSNLTVHTENAFTVTYNSGMHTYQQSSDLYYTK